MRKLHAGLPCPQDGHPIEKEAMLRNHQLPELHEGTLDFQELNQYRKDLNDYAKIQEIIIKNNRLQMTNSKTNDLDSTIELLMCRTVNGIQIRYHWDDLNWCDTLLWKNSSIRLIRICHNEGEIGPYRD